MVTRPAETLRAVERLGGSFALVDLETTGGNAAWHRVIEVGIVVYEAGRIVEEWGSLVNPGIRIPAGIEAFTGITNAMVEDAPSFADIAAAVRSRIDGRIFVAHNARFDHGFLRNEFRRLGGRLGGRVLCTVRLSRRLFPEHASHSLDAVIARHSLECTARHRALGDARVLAGFLDRVVGHFGVAEVESAIEALTAAPALPPQLPPELVDELPDGPGVYRFYGEDDVLLYIGKSTHLRSRVLQHFAADHRSTSEQQLARLVRRVDWTETAGELGALLEECRLVKRLQPVRNRRLRAIETLWTIRLERQAQGMRPVVVEFDPLTLESAFGFFRSRKEAGRVLERIVTDAGLCQKTLGLEPGSGSCFAYQLQRCRGACVGAEPLALHDARLALAFAPHQLRAWPFKGPIGIRERGLGGDEIHVFDAWRHLGTARAEMELGALIADPSSVPFDPDVYRILARVLAKRSAPVIDLAARFGRH
ncbi:MAG TPA: exonuclease domain-containing protein [Steroidobacteraceae bacterium]|nr:exonuclease domain-containing protein [Steroidobacteraceae bacterium]